MRLRLDFLEGQLREVLDNSVVSVCVVVELHDHMPHGLVLRLVEADGWVELNLFLAIVGLFNFPNSIRCLPVLCEILQDQYLTCF